jgi:hypothetical protein
MDIFYASVIAAFFILCWFSVSWIERLRAGE